MDIQQENLTTDEKAMLLMKIEIGRQVKACQQGNLVLTNLSGDGGYTKGEVDFETWKYMAETYIDDNYSEGLLKATIRKFLVGEAVRHLRSQGDVTVAEIRATLELHYGELNVPLQRGKISMGLRKNVKKTLHAGGYVWSRSYLRS